MPVQSPISVRPAWARAGGAPSSFQAIVQGTPAWQLVVAVGDVMKTPARAWGATIAATAIEKAAVARIVILTGWEEMGY